MGRKELLLDSVQKLLGLNVPDNEIISDLVQAGITKKEAIELLQEAKKSKGNAAELKGKTAESIRQFKGIDESNFSVDELDFGQNKGLPEEEPLPQKKEEKFAEKIPSRISLSKPKPLEIDLSKYDLSSHEEKSISELWEKGILATVDARLNEMKELKNEINSRIDAKIGERVEQTVKRINVLHDSQKALLLSKVDSELERKSRELTSLIDSKIRELKELNLESKTKLNEFDKASVEFDGKISQVNSKLNELNETRSELIAEINSGLAQEKSRIKAFLEESNQKRQETDSRIKRTLDLEQKLVEGILDDAKNKIERFSDEKKNEALIELRAKEKAIDSKLNELNSLASRINPEQLEKRMNELREINSELMNRARANEVFREFKNEMKSFAEQETGKISKSMGKESDELLEEKSKEIDSFLKEKESEFLELNKKINIDELTAAKEELELFQKQFVNVVQKNVNEFNEFKKQLDSYVKQQQDSMDRRIRLIDDKITELNKFEENFAKEMGLEVEKLAKKKKNEK